MFNARASVMRVSGANGARNPNNKGENMPRRQNVTSGLINSQDFRIHRPTHFVTVIFFTYNYLFYFIGNSIQILAVKFLDFHSYLRVYTFQFKKEKRRKEELFESLGKVSKRRKKEIKIGGGRRRKKEERKAGCSLQMQVSMVLFSWRRGQGREFHRDCCNSIAVMRDARIGNVTNHRGESCLAIKLGTGSVLGRVPSPLVQLHPSTRLV